MLRSLIALLAALSLVAGPAADAFAAPKSAKPAEKTASKSSGAKSKTPAAKGGSAKPAAKGKSGGKDAAASKGKAGAKTAGKAGAKGKADAKAKLGAKGKADVKGKADAKGRPDAKGGKGPAGKGKAAAGERAGDEEEDCLPEAAPAKASRGGKSEPAHGKAKAGTKGKTEPSGKAGSKSGGKAGGETASGKTSSGKSGAGKSGAGKAGAKGKAGDKSAPGKGGKSGSGKTASSKKGGAGDRETCAKTRTKIAPEPVKKAPPAEERRAPEPSASLPTGPVPYGATTPPTRPLPPRTGPRPDNGLFSWLRPRRPKMTAPPTLATLVGKSDSELKAMLGDPEVKHGLGDGAMWTYRLPDCALMVFLQRGTLSGLKVTGAQAGPLQRGGDTPDLDQCLKRSVETEASPAPGSTRP